MAHCIGVMGVDKTQTCCSGQVLCKSSCLCPGCVK